MAQNQNRSGKPLRHSVSGKPEKPGLGPGRSSKKRKPPDPLPAKNYQPGAFGNAGKKARRLPQEESELMEDLFRILVETIDAAVFVLYGSRIIYLNPAALAQTGYGREELLSRPFWEIVHPDHQKMVKKLGLEYQDGKALPFREEIRLITQSGETRWMEYRGGVFEFRGKPVPLATVFDITEQKRAETFLREAEERYRDLYENVPSMYFTVDPRGIVISVNEYGASQLGYTVQELKNQSVLKVFRPEDHAAVLKQLDVCERSPGEVHQWELQKIRQDGSLLWVEEFARLVEDRQGNPTILIVCQDITPRKKMEDALREAGELLEQRVRQRTEQLEKANADLQREIRERRKAEIALQESEERLRTLMEKIPNGISVISAKGKILYFNPAFSKMFGYSSEEMRDRHPYNFMHPDDSHRAAERIQALLKGEPESPSEYRILHKNGGIIPVEVYSRLIQYKENPAVLSVVIDITERKQAEEALKLSEERYRTLVEQAAEGILVANEAGWHIDVNTSGCKMLGYSREEILKLHVTDLYLPEDLAKYPPGIEELRKGAILRVERKLKCKDGSALLVEASAKMLPDGRIQAIIRDIAERKVAEEALKKERDRAQRYLDVAGAIFVLIGRDEKVQLINKKGCEILGYEEKRILRRNWFDHFLPETIREPIRNNFRLLLSGSIDNFEYFENPVKTRSGEERIIAWHNILLTDENGDILGTLSSGEDITERKKAEGALRESEQRYALAVEAGKVGIWNWDLASDEIYLAPNLQAMLGYLPGEIGSRSEEWARLIHPEDRRRVRVALNRLLKGKSEVYESEHRKIHKDGSIRWFYGRGNALRDENGKVVWIIGTATDITERKQVEVELKKHRDRLEEMVQERTARLQEINRELRREIQSRKRTEAALNKTGEELRRLSAHQESAREEERARIAREIHDELGQLLSILQMNLAWMEMNLGREPETLLSKIHSTSDLIGNTIKAVQRISQELRPSVLDHLGFLAALSWHTKEFQAQTGIRCRLDIRAKEIHLPGDQSLALFRVFQEALTNVLRHAQASEVSIVVEEKGKNLRLSVSDNGIGIRKEPLNDLNSLGLIGIRERIHGLNGTVRITGSPSKGTRLTVSVPLK